MTDNRMTVRDLLVHAQLKQLFVLRERVDSHDAARATNLLESETNLVSISLPGVFMLEEGDLQQFKDAVFVSSEGNALTFILHHYVLRRVIEWREIQV